MELMNRSGLALAASPALDKEGREHLVVVAKATYAIDWDSGTTALKEHGRPIVYSDEHIGEPGLSAPVYEADTALRKPRCDVLLDATAHSPDGRPVTELEVAASIGDWKKGLLVVGDRVWLRGALGVTATPPQPFTSMRIHYGRAFGGPENPVGVGHSDDPDAAASSHARLPNIEDPASRVTAPNQPARPASFGPIGRHWEPRRRFGGTYDARWREEVAPLLPEDFDDRFFQSAPPDQQIDPPRGGELVRLLHLVPGRALASFALPAPALSLKVLLASRHTRELAPAVDTLFIEPDAARLTYVYRAALPLGRRGIFGVAVVGAGPVCEKWWAYRAYGTPDCGCNGDTRNDRPAEGPAPDAQA